MQIDFFKYHALGNDYIVIDASKTKFTLNHENIKLLCDRHKGIGADGVVFGPVSEKNFVMKLFNSDGSEAEVSGNGVRIFAKYLWDNRYAKSKRFDIETLSGKITVTVLDNDANLVEADIGAYSFKSTDIPADGPVREVVSEVITINSNPYSVTCVNVGNPHAVVFEDELLAKEVLKIGPALESHYLFPKKINVNFAQVTGKDHIRIKIWERGSGYTLASGSSACAAVCAANKLGLVGSKVNVEMPGGSVEVEIKNQHVFLTGPVESICSGSFSADLKKKFKIGVTVTS